MINNELQKKFKELKFEAESHTYTLNNRVLTPVSNVVKRYYEEFDVQQQAQKYAERHGGNAAEIAAGWEENRVKAADFGTQVHDFAERYYYNATLQPSNTHEMAVVKFWKDLLPHIKKVEAELRVFNEYLGFAGTIDNIFYDEQRGGYIISDYKTNKDLYKNFMGKLMFEPFDFLLDNSFNHYQVQLSSYQLALEKQGYKIIERWVIWLKPDGTYEKIFTTDYSMHVEMDLIRAEIC